MKKNFKIIVFGREIEKRNLLVLNSRINNIKINKIHRLRIQSLDKRIGEYHIEISFNDISIDEDKFNKILKINELIEFINNALEIR